MNPDSVEFTATARGELDEALEYIAARNPGAAIRLRTAIGARLAALAAPHPRVDGPAVSLINDVSCRRSFVHPLTLYYDRAPGLVLVLHVRHHARDPIER